MQIEVPPKPRRKKLDVPIHGGERQIDANIHKTFSANHPNKIAEDKQNGRISKKYLAKENELLSKQNLELQEQLSSMDHYLNKKVSRLKEKLNSLQKINEEVVNENNVIKIEYQEMLSEFNEVKKELSASKPCHNCEALNKLLDKTKTDYGLLKRNNAELLEDENMLKNVIYRLNVQLEAYQEKLRKHKINIKNPILEISRPETRENIATISSELKANLPEDHWNHSHVPISWGKVNLHTLGPLLDSYQETIAEKEEIIQNYEVELSNFTEKLKEIIKENESLHRKLNEDDECSRSLALNVENLKSELKSVKEQNDLLIKKCAMKQDQIEEVLKCYEQKIDELKRDYKVLHEEYCKSRTDIATLREKNKSLADIQNDFKNERQQYIPISVHTASVNECKKWYEELKHQYENEKVKLKETITSLSAKVTDLTDKITELNGEKGLLEDKIKSSEKQIKKNESKFTELQKTLNEVQLSRNVLKKQLHKAMEFAKDLVKEQEALLKALNQRHQENKAVKKLGSDIANRMATLRTQLKNVQKEAFQELSEVEQRLQEQDKLISSLKQEHVQEIDRLRQIIKDKEQKNVLFKENSSIPMPHYLLFREKTVYQ